MLLEDAGEFELVPWVYRAEVQRVVDGDTLDCRVTLYPKRVLWYQDEPVYDLGFAVYSTVVSSLGMPKYERIRLFGIDAWEPKGEERTEGLKATEFVKDWLAKYDNKVVMRTIKDTKGKFGRYLGVFYPPESVPGDELEGSLNSLLVEEGHAEYASY